MGKLHQTGVNLFPEDNRGQLRLEECCQAGKKRLRVES